jgi:hypothetical protein
MGGTRHRAGLAVVAAVALAGPVGHAPAWAADARQAPQEYDVNRQMIEALQKKIDERDQMILNLLDRVERLERQEAAAARARPIPAALNGVNAQMPAGAAPRHPETAQRSQPAQAQPPASAQAGPGQFEVSEEDAQRALERALVQTGASLLQPGQLEVVPSLAFQFDQTARPSQIALTLSGNVVITEDVVRSKQLEAATLLRMGLPLGLQVEIGIPYEYKGRSTVSRVMGSGLSNRTSDEVGLGDPTFAVTKQVLFEHGGLPGLFVSGTWDTDYGQIRNGVALGSGFDEFRFGVTAVKRQDPLVFTAGMTYQTSLESRNVTPGDQYIPALGMLFAVSPETSLRFAQQVSFVRPARLGGSTLPGSDQTSAVFTFGLLSILARGLTLDLSASIGETPDAPDFSFRLAFPIRLN